MPDVKRMRILQVVGNLNRGGTETWLMNILRHIDRDRYCMDFLVHTTSAGAYDDLVRRHDARIIPCLHPSRPHVYARNFRSVLRSNGPYDVVHSHIHHYSGYVLRLAERAGIRVRIAHSHSDTARVQAGASRIRKIYFSLSQRWIRHHASLGLAVSRAAAKALYGSAWEQDERIRILYCGIDPTAFRTTGDPEAVRGEFGIPSNAFVVGHVGRFTTVKNHAFLIDIAAAATRKHPDLYFLLVGEGELREPIEQRVRLLGLEARVKFAGGREDIPRLMTGAMDVFVLPSFYEGLPVAAIEAQAAGLSCVLSDTITPEVDIVPGLVRRRSLADPPSAWVEALVAARGGVRAESRTTALAHIEQSPFDVRKGVAALGRYYES
jgi:glycosyltransferase involved in cell wall biosynthesis